MVIFNVYQTYTFDKLQQAMINYPETAAWLSHLDMLVCLITSVFVIGAFIAVFNEDAGTNSGRWYCAICEFLPVSFTNKLKISLECTALNLPKKLNHLGVINGGKTISTEYYDEPKLTLKKYFTSCLFEMYTAILKGELWSLLLSWFIKFYSKSKLKLEILWLMYKAKSKRQIIYLIEKKVLNIPIDFNESEMQSYNEAKKWMQVEGLHCYTWKFKDVTNKNLLCDDQKVVMISSYSYLDMIRNDKVQQAAIDAAKLYSTGNHGPRMLGGNTHIINDLEKVVAKFFSRDKSIVFATGYLACMSGIAAVCGKGDLIVTDSRNHASLQTGFRISLSKVKTFSHNDFEQCEHILKKFRHKYNNCWIVIESVYSMDGDIANLPACNKLALQYNCSIMIDEAHGLGVLGKTGRGLEEHFNMIGCATLIVGTFSKSIGGIGGYITGDAFIIDFLDFHTQGNVFSAPLTAYSCGGAIEAFNIIINDNFLVEKLQNNIKYFRNALISGLGQWPANYPDSSKYIVGGIDGTAVIPIIFKDDFHRLFIIARMLKHCGYFAPPVLYPACPARYPRFRITATSALTKDIIDDFVKKLIHCTVAAPTSSFFKILSGI